MSSHRRYCYVDFSKENPPLIANESSEALATKADNQVDYFFTQKGHYFEMLQEAATFTNISFTKDSDGWQIFDIDDDGDSLQITQGILASGTRMSFVAGTDAFFLKVKVDIPTVAEYDVFHVGFRKLASYADVGDAAALGTAYEDVALIGCNAGNITTVTRLAAGTADIDDEGDDIANGGQATLEVHVTSAGVVTFKVDGAAVSGNANDLTITSAAVMIPTIICTATGDTGSSMGKLLTYECGIA